MIVRNAWYVAAWSSEIGEAPLARRVCDEPIVLFRAADGRVSALRDACAHRGAPLSLGTVTAKGLRCNYQGVVFAPNGRCAEVPGQDATPRSLCVRPYPLVEKNGALWIWMGDPALAESAEIKAYSYHEGEARWPTSFGVLPCKANYLLLIDNLLDATHLAYVHPSSVGGAAPDVHYKATSSLKATPEGIRLDRLMPGSPPPPVYRNCVPFEGLVDRWQEFDFVAPAVVEQYSGAVEAGASREDWRCTRFDMRIYHAITPINETESYYFYAVSNGHDREDPAANAIITSEIERTLAEDKTMVEAQQARLSELGEDWLVNIRSDAARVMMRRAVERLSARDRPVNEAA